MGTTLDEATAQMNLKGIPYKKRLLKSIITAGWSQRQI